MRKTKIIRIIAILALFIGILSIINESKIITGNSIIETNNLLSYLSKNNIYGLILIISSAILLFGVQLEERVQGAETKPSDEEEYFYHATTTGERGEHLDSFLGSGARGDIAEGYGQGKGFYVWRGREKAVHHAIKQIKTEEGRPGKLMLVRIRGNYNPRDWDIDYEVNAPLAKRFLYENFDKFKELDDFEMPGEVTGTSGVRKIIPKKSKKFGTSLYIHGGIGVSMDDKGGFSEGDMRDGAYLSCIIQQMQRKFPELVRKFEEENLNKVHALKYVGRDPLKVEGIEVMEDDGTWKEHQRT